MTPRLTDDLQQAVDASVNEPLRAEHQGTQKVYFIYNEEMHRKAMQALEEKADVDAIQEGIDAMEAGRMLPLAEADKKMRQKLGFGPRQQ